MIDVALRVGALGMKIFQEIAVFAVAALLLASVASQSQAQQFQINDFRVDGNTRIEDATIISYTGLAAGEAVTGGQLNDAAQAIRATGLFETVEVIPQGGLLFIRVVELPTISRINFEGNNRLTDAELAAPPTWNVRMVN